LTWGCLLPVRRAALTPSNECCCRKLPRRTRQSHCCKLTVTHGQITLTTLPSLLLLPLLWRLRLRLLAE
jgi:hypothetical protein